MAGTWLGAVDIGATKTLVTVRQAPLSSQWHPDRRASVAFATAHDPTAEVARIAAAFERLPGAGEGRLLAVGCAAPGPLDPGSGVVVRSPNLGWRDVPLGPLLAERLGAPVSLDDDGRVGALGEALMGAGRGSVSVAYLTVGTGVGGGLVIGGRIHAGAHGLAGEVGHLLVDPAGPPCGCGRRGHVEAYAGGAALARRARSAWPVGQAAIDGSTPRDAAGILAAAAGGDPAARGILAAESTALARAIASLAAVLDPAVIVVGGSLGLRRAAARAGRDRSGPRGAPRGARLGERAGRRGRDGGAFHG